MTHAVFFVSDRTGITAENLGNSLLTQFNGLEVQRITLPYIDTTVKAKQAVEQINHTAKQNGTQPLLFSTLLDSEVREIIKHSDGVFIDFFDTFINTLEKVFNTPSAPIVGRSHGMGEYKNYRDRIDAVNFALNNDDGITLRNYPCADIILIGVSRSGKTPTSLYLALHYGILAANYPLTEDDMISSSLPSAIEPFGDKLFGLTIDPQRLNQIREERRSKSRYSSYEQCHFEVTKVEKMLRHAQVPFIDTSKASIEEISTTILQKTGLQRRLHA